MRKQTGSWASLMAAAPLLAAACGGGEPPRAPEPGPGASPAAARGVTPAPAPGDAILRDADLAGLAPAPAEAPAASSPIAPAPLPPEVVAALQPRSLEGGSQELAISFRDPRSDALLTALDAASVLDDTLPPAAPAPDPY